MNASLPKLSSDPKIRQRFLSRLVQLKTTLLHYETSNSAVRVDMVANEFRKVLEAFVDFAHSERQNSQFYDALLQLIKQLQDHPAQSFVNEGDKGYIKALLKIIQTVGNYGSHHQVEPEKELSSHHIVLCRIALYTLVDYYVREEIEHEIYAFLKLPHQDSPASKTKYLKLFYKWKSSYWLVSVMFLLVLGGSYLLSSKEVKSFDYYAYLNHHDHYTAKNKKHLTHAFNIVTQDRANYHRFGLKDSLDQTDPRFHEKDQRRWLEKMLKKKGAMSEQVKQIIETVYPIYVKVSVSPDKVVVSIEQVP